MTALRTFLIFTALALPWLSPFAGGPSAAAVPWVVSLLCVGVMGWAAAGSGAGAVVQRVEIPRKAALGFAVMIALFGLHAMRGVAAGTGAGVEAIATVVAVLALGMMVWLGAWMAALPSTAGGLWRALAKVWLAVALLSVGMALCQYLRVEHWFAPWISASGDGTAFANLRQRNQFATLCGMGLLALLYLRQTAWAASTASTGTRSGWFDLAWPWAAAAVLALGNALSSSRTGGLQWLLVALVLWCWRGSLHARVRWLGLGALGYYVAALMLMPWLADAVGNASSGLWGRVEQGAGGFSRLALYSNTLDLIAQKPWLGWGWRELAFAHYSTHFDNRFMELLDNAHNLPLHLAVELGLPFALAVCGALVWWVWRSAPWREVDAGRQLAWGVLLLIGVHSMVEYPLWYGPFLMALGLCVGMLCARSAHQDDDQDEDAPLPQLAPSFITTKATAIKTIAIGLLCFAGYAAFDYHRVSQIYLSTESRSAWYGDDALATAQKSVLFGRQARFAELMVTPVRSDNAVRVLTLALDLVHYSPEPRVIEALIESATMLHFDDVAMFHLARYKEAYPQDYAAWSALK